jgi:hypothetical protein
VRHADGVGHGVVDVGVRREPVATRCATGQVADPDEFVECGAGPVLRFRFWLGCYHGPEFGSAGDDFGQQWCGRYAAAENQCGLLSSPRLRTLLGVARELGIGCGLRRFPIGDDVDDDAAGAAVVDDCGTVGTPTLTRKSSRSGGRRAECVGAALRQGPWPMFNAAATSPAAASQSSHAKSCSPVLRRRSSSAIAAYLRASAAALDRASATMLSINAASPRTSNIRAIVVVRTDEQLP